MRKSISITVAICFVVIILILAGIVFVKFRAQGFSAREEPTLIEGWLARRARRLAIPSDAVKRINPVAVGPEVLADARAHWADHCAICHANNGSGAAEMGKQMYPPAPDMRLPATQNLSDGELFYVIQNGIRLTGMPAWGTGTPHDETDSWKLVRFIRHLPQLTQQEEEEMKAANPRSPAELQEEQEERDFLQGEEHEQSQKHQHR